MKKAFCLFLVLYFFATLSGCRKPVVQESEPTMEPTIQTQATAESIPLITISLPNTTETVTAEDGTVIFHYVYPNLSMVLPDAEVTNKITLDHLKRLDSHLSAKDSIAQSAQAAYISGQEFRPYLFAVHYTPTRIDQNVLSINGLTVSYRGGAHADQYSFGMNYDLQTGEVLTLGSILKHLDAKKSLEELVVKQLDTIADSSRLYDDYANLARMRFLQDESHDENWYFSAKGLCFFFSPYEIAPYTSGVIVAEIPYEALNGIIADAFLPAERNPATGTLTQLSFETADQSKYTQIAELILQNESDKVLYSTDATVYDVRIYQTHEVTGYRSAIFAAYALTSGDALMLEAPAQLRNTLTLSYVTGDKTIEFSH